MLAVSSRLGPYEIIASLGAGGMGEVYRARDTRLGRDVAVKVLPEPFAGDPARRARFEREARAVAALSHPNILAIHDYGTHESITFAVMELLEGETLRTRLTQGPLQWREVVEVGAAIADGLAVAHAKGIIHRDLKPENLFLTSDGRAKILDFGLARVTPIPSQQVDTSPYVPAVTDAGTVLGTVGYMSPEQVRGQPAEAPSDLFSFGCVLYEMVTGRRAFHRETAAETMTAILHDEPPDIADAGQAIPVELGHLIRQCLAKKPAQRLQLARDLALALRATANQATPVPSLSPPRREPIGERSVEAVAVLPFENVGGDPKTEYLSDGLADHLIISLSQARRHGLKVRPFSSVSRYKRQPADVPTIGRELNVQLVVSGTLHQVGDDLWVSVAVVDAHEDDQLWGKRYQGKLGGILDLQDQVARDVAAKLSLNLTSDEQQRLTKRHTEDPEAYLLFREGIYHENKFTEEGMKSATDCLSRAIQRDPNYALAYTEMGNCHVLLGALYCGPRKCFPEGKKYFEAARRIDDTLAEVHSGLANIYLMCDWSWQAAERELRVALQLGPNTPLPHTFHAFYLAAMGRTADALVAMRPSLELDPVAAPRRNEVAMCHNWLRQYDRAITEAQKAIELDSNFPLAYAELATAYVQRGMVKDAIAALQGALQRGQMHPRVQGMLGYAYAVAGQTAEAQSVLAEMSRLAQGRFAFALPIARIHAALGDRDRAFEWLHKACDERDSHAIWIKVDPTLDNLRSDPRFNDLLRHMGLPVEDETRSETPDAARLRSRLDTPVQPSNKNVQPTDRLPRLLIWLLAALVLGGLIGTAVYFLTRGNKSTDAGKAAGEAPAIEAVAVLPFVYDGEDPKTELLSSTLAGHIIDSLGQVGRADLKVRPFSSVSRYKRERPDNPTIAIAVPGTGSTLVPGTASTPGTGSTPC